PSEIAPEALRFDVDLAPGESRTIFVSSTCCGETVPPAPKFTYDQAFEKASGRHGGEARCRCRITSSSYLFNEWIHRSAADIDMMVTMTPHGPYPYAGIPW